MDKSIKQYLTATAVGIFTYSTIIAAIIISLSMMLCTGCMTGHNIYREKEMTGLDLSLPIGQSFIGLQIGATKTVTAVVRGGVSFETTSANHGGLFAGAGGQSKITQLKSNAQLNEGYLAEVLCSTNVPLEVKMILASNLTEAATAPYFPGSILQTEGSTIHIGRNAILSNNVERLTPEARGLDRLVDKTADVIGTNVVNNVLDTTGNVVHDVVNPMQGTVEQISNTAKEIGNTIGTTTVHIKGILASLIATIIGALLLVIVIGFLLGKRARQPKHIHVDAGLEQDFPNGYECATPTPDKSDQTATHKTKQQVHKIGWFNRLRTWVISVVLFAMRVFVILPPGARKRIKDMLVDYWEKKRAEKRNKKNCSK